MDPIIPIVPPTPPSHASKPEGAMPRGVRADQLASYFAFASAALAICLCAYFWARFLENDENRWGMASAFLLCFGGGAFAYIPAWVTGKIARRCYKDGPDKKRYKLALFLILPWFILALTLLFFSNMAFYYSLAIVLITFSLFFWAAYSLSKI